MIAVLHTHICKDVAVVRVGADQHALQSGRVAVRQTASARWDTQQSVVIGVVLGWTCWAADWQYAVMGGRVAEEGKRSAGTVDLAGTVGLVVFVFATGT
jgi:hypothetical protein